MDQFRHIGEVLGSMKALMVMQDEIPINQRQCILLLDIFCMAFDCIAEGIKMNLKLEEKNIKWKALEQPLKEIYRIFREGEVYVKHCMDNKDWWGKAVIYHQNKDCVEFHIHNLLCYFPAVIEAIETAGEISGLNQDDMEKKRIILKRKYDKEWNDPKLFGFRFGKEYLVPKEICYRLESSWREDRWLLLEALRDMKNSDSISKNEMRLADLLIRRVNLSRLDQQSKLFPSSVLLGSKDFTVRRRLGGGNQYKEIHWLGEQFALRQFHGEIEPLGGEISALLSLSHPNILQYLCGFHDEDKKEFYLVMELMNKDIYTHMKENCGARRLLLFAIPVVVDLLLQIARGMEYLHARNIFHGDLNPSTVLLKPRYLTEGYFYAKVTGFSLPGIKSCVSAPSSAEDNASTNMWLAPEVLAEQEQKGSMRSSVKYSEKADVYSFGMLAFDLLTGKIPFEDGYLPGDKSSKNIRAGGRPLFPFTTPKYLVNLTKRCWHSDPSQRPSFSSICRILRYTKRFLVMNPISDEGQPQLNTPSVEYLDIEVAFLKKFSSYDLTSVSQIPFQMFSYRILEKPRVFSNKKVLETASDVVSNDMEDQILQASDLRSVCSEIPERRVFAGGDTRSVCSEAPDNNFISLIKVSDTKSKEKTGAKNLKIDCPEQTLSGIVVTSDKAMPSPRYQDNRVTVLPEIPETNISSPRGTKSSTAFDPAEKKPLSPKKKGKDSTSTSSSSSLSKKKSASDLLSRSSSDTVTRLAYSEPSRKKSLPISSSLDSLDKKGFKVRNVRPEPKSKRMLSLKIINNVKPRQGSDTSKSSSSWNPCGRSVKMGRETKLSSVATPKKRPVSGSADADS